MHYLYLAGAILAEVIATTFLKASNGFTVRGASMATIVGYSMAFYLLALTLKTMPTGIAYAIWSGVGIVLITAIAWLVQGQKLDLPALAGMGLIIAGVIIMNLFSKAIPHQ